MMVYLNFAYLLSALGFIFGLKFMGKAGNANKGNIISAISMFLAITATVFLCLYQSNRIPNFILLLSILSVGTLIGRYLSYKYDMRRIPELISLFNAFGGLCALLIGLNEVYHFPNESFSLSSKIILIGGITLGGASFTGSIVAFYKLGGKLKKRLKTKWILYFSLFLFAEFIGLHLYDPEFSSFALLCLRLGALSLFIGFFIAMPIGGADMPVLISVLNAVTGIATAFSGIIFESTIMLLGGILVGFTGIFLSLQMSKAMNRSLKAIFSSSKSTIKAAEGEQNVQSISHGETASLLSFSKKVAIVPGFGMAVAQAQKECFELQKLLASKEIELDYIIHPVAGRMPGHMNVLLAEANVPYDEVFELEDINNDFANSDVAFVIGANDVTNPAAKTDPQSAIYGMPILDVENAGTVLFIKRSMASGYAGVDNELFFRDNTMMLFSDAKKMVEDIVKSLD